MTTTITLEQAQQAIQAASEGLNDKKAAKALQAYSDKLSELTGSSLEELLEAERQSKIEALSLKERCKLWWAQEEPANYGGTGWLGYFDELLCAGEPAFKDPASLGVIHQRLRAISDCIYTAQQGGTASCSPDEALDCAADQMKKVLAELPGFDPRYTTGDSLTGEGILTE